MIGWWQEAGVVVIVAGAVWYLARRLFGTLPQKTPQTFVPLSKLKSSSGGQSSHGCH